MKDYDRIYGELHNLGLSTRPSTIVEALPIVGEVTTWIIQSVLPDRDGGATCFLQFIAAGPDGSANSLRLVLPPKVVARIVSQHASLKDRAADRRSPERIAREALKTREQTARRTIASIREERRARRQGNGS